MAAQHSKLASLSLILYVLIYKKHSQCDGKEIEREREGRDNDELVLERCIERDREKNAD